MNWIYLYAFYYFFHESQSLFSAAWEINCITHKRRKIQKFTLFTMFYHMCTCIHIFLVKCSLTNETDNSRQRPLYWTGDSFFFETDILQSNLCLAGDRKIVRLELVQLFCLYSVAMLKKAPQITYTNAW